MKSFVLTALLITLYVFGWSSDRWPQSIAEDKIVIAGRVVGATAKDSVTMVLKRDFIYLNVGAETIRTGCSKDGEFSFTFHSAHFAVISLLLNKTNPFISYRYVEPGDSINCAVTISCERTVTACSGKGVAKFDCMQAIEKKRSEINENSFSKIPEGLFAEDSVMNQLRGSFHQADVTARHLLNIVEMYKATLSAEMLKLLEADILGERGRDKCFLISYYLVNADSVQWKAIQKLFLTNVAADPASPDNVEVYSDNYIEFLYRASQVKLKLQNRKPNSLNGLYDLIETQFSGLVRERVITSFLLRPHSGASNQEYTCCLQRALKVCHNEPYISVLQKQFEMTSRGAVAFDFNLPDAHGKFVSLDELRGKVVFVDFWFTGCSACKKLAASLEEKVIPEFNNSTTSFVSINLDEDKGRWLKSLASGGYSSPEAINLFTEGLAFNHPLAQHYNIQGCPFVLMIDKEGRIIEINPSREPGEIINLLQKAADQ